MATKEQCIKLINLCKLINISNYTNNERSKYINYIIKTGPCNYYNSKKFGDCDDFDYYRNKHIYLYKANTSKEILEYIESGMNFDEQRELNKINLKIKN